MVTLSVCIEMFWPGQDPVEKLRRVATTGIGAYEFWTWSDKDVDAMAAVQAETGLACAGHLSEPGQSLVARDTEAALMKGIRNSIQTAQKLGAPGMIVTTGNVLADETSDVTMRRARRRLKAMAAICEDHGLKLYLEPLNPVVDHQGYWLTTMAQAADLVAEVDSPALTILYDIYHQQITEGNLISLLRTYLPVIGHIHTAGVPGRHELLGNEIDYKTVFAEIDRLGYDGYVGLEFRPLFRDEAALAQALELAQTA